MPSNPHTDISTLLGILTDKQEDAVQYYMPAGNVGIDLAVDNGSEDAVEIRPNAVTPLSINVTNTTEFIVLNWLSVFGNRENNSDC